jgi:hypothetical protein
VLDKIRTLGTIYRGETLGTIYRGETLNTIVALARIKFIMATNQLKRNMPNVIIFKPTEPLLSSTKIILLLLSKMLL